MEGDFGLKSVGWSLEVSIHLSNSNPSGEEISTKYARREEEKDGFKKN